MFHVPSHLKAGYKSPEGAKYTHDNTEDHPLIRNTCFGLQTNNVLLLCRASGIRGSPVITSNASSSCMQFNVVRVVAKHCYLQYLVIEVELPFCSKDYLRYQKSYLLVIESLEYRLLDI